MNFFKKIQYNSPIILTFAIISFIALILNWITKGHSNLLFFSVYRSSWLNPLFWFRLIGHVLGHVSLEHYTSNILLLLLLGPMLEEKYGSKNILIMIVIVAIATGLINIIFFQSILLGASGIVFMAIILSSITSADNGKIPLTLIIVTIIYIGQEIVSGLTVDDNISHLTHIIGGFCGGGFGLILNRQNKI